MSSKKQSKTFMIAVLMLAIGTTSGFFLRPYVIPETVADATDEEDAPATGNGHGPNVLELSEAALQTMSLSIGKFEKRDYYEKVVLPAEFVESLPDGRQQIVAPVGGQIRSVMVAPGQAISPGSPMFELDVTDEQVTEAQVALLSVMSDIDSTEALLDRSRRLAEKEIIAAKKVIELELQLNELVSRRQALEQELLLRGLTESQLNQLKESKELVRSFLIYAPELPTTSSDSQTNTYTVESLDSFIGKTLARGEVLCHLTHHGRLLIKGLAFESDLEQIVAARQDGRTFTAEIGESGTAIIREGLPLHSIDNHVDPESQTYSVFVSIDNEVVDKNQDQNNRSYLQWRFKAGQRAHLEFPIKQWKSGIVVPITALVEEGLQTFVFKKYDHTHQTDGGEVINEFERVPVKVLHRDRQFAVLEKDIALDLYEKYALDQAYQLNLALKQAASGGGGHSHVGHSH